MSASENCDVAQLLREGESVEAFLADIETKVGQMLELLPWKQECAVDRVKSDYKKVTNRLAEMEQSTRIALVREVDKHKGLVERMRQGVKGQLAELNECVASLLSGDGERVEPAVAKLTALKEEYSGRPVAVNEMVVSLQSLELLDGDAFVQLEQVLRAPSLHFIKLCALCPADLTLSVVSERNLVGQQVEVEIRPSKSDARFTDYLSMRVEDAEKNVVGHRLKALTATGVNVQILQFTPTLAGRYRVTVTLYGEHANGSPLTTLVSAAPASRAFPPSSHTSFADMSGVGGGSGQTERAARRVTTSCSALQSVLASVGAGNVAKNLSLPWPQPSQLAASNDRRTPTEAQPPVASAETARAALLLPRLPAAPPPRQSTEAVSEVQTTVTSRQAGARLGRGLMRTAPSRGQLPRPLYNGRTQTVTSMKDDLDVCSADSRPSVATVAAGVARERSTSFGAVAVDSARVNLADLLGSGRGVRGRHVGTVGVFGESEPAEARLSGPIGCAKNERDGLWIVCDTSHNKVKLFASDLSARQTVPVDFVRPSAVAVLPGGAEFAVKDNSSIRVFDAELGKCVATFERTRLPYEAVLGPFAGSPTSEIWVAPTPIKPQSLANQKPRHNCAIIDGNCGARAEVVFLDRRAPTDGPVRRHPYPPLAGLDGAAADQSKPRFLDCRDGVLAISDLGVNRVAVARTRDGAPIGVMGAFGRRPGEFSYASGVSIDGGGNFLVGDSRANRVQLFGADGSFKCVLALPPPGAPLSSDIHLADDGQLMITCLRSCIAPVFQLSAA